MKSLFSLLSFLIFTLSAQFAFAQSAMTTCNQSKVPSASCSSSGVLLYEKNSSTPTFKPPSQCQVLDTIGKLQLTYSVNLDTSAITGFTYDKNNWGVLIGATDPKTYYSGSKLDNNVTVTSDVTKMSINGAYYAGTVVVTIDFTKSGNVLSTEIIGKIVNGSIQFQPLYVNGNSNITSSSLAFNWQADTGAMINGPSIGVKAQDSAFVVTLTPPSSLNAVEKASTTATSLTATTNPNSLSGYVIVYWLDTDASGNSTGCKANPGGWQFKMNPVTLTTADISAYTCTYTQYKSSFNTGGTSNVLGCPGLVTTTAFLSNTINLTTDLAAIPNITETNPTKISSDSNGTPSGCYNVVYIPGSQSSWSKGNIKNGEIYGVMAWALNNAIDSSGNISPNYSLAHSNISYISGINLPLASTDKSPNLPKTTDCFVVTAASGNVNSDAVFYWRILRDEYLTPMGFTPFYYRHAQNWAQWVEEHPKLKPTLNAILEYSGKTIYHISGFAKDTAAFFKSLLQKASSVLNQEAAAQEIPLSPLENKTPETPSPSGSNSSSPTEEIKKQEEKTTPKEEVSKKEDLTKKEDSTKPEEIKQTETASPMEEAKKQEIPLNNEEKTKTEDPSKQELINKNIMPPKLDKPKKEKVKYQSRVISAKDLQPNYDLFITGGILQPSDDKDYYDKYYTSQPTGHFEMGVNYLFWFGDIGLSTGLLGRYIFNTTTNKATELGTQQEYTRKFYALNAEALLGLRYRNPSWTYIQPGIYVGAGISRFREETTTDTSSTNTNKPLGVTNYSPIYEFGGNLDISLVPIFSVYPGELGWFLSDILLRLSASYNINPAKSLSSTGIFLQGGFVFLFE